MVKFLLKIATENSRKLYIHSRDDLKIFFTQVRGDKRFRKTKCRTVYLQTNVEYLLVKFSCFSKSKKNYKILEIYTETFVKNTLTS